MEKSLKEIGNDYFKTGNYEEALEKYLEGMSIKDLSTDNKLNLLKNQSMCFLKLHKYKETVTTCDKVLEIKRADEKSLYRRSQANFELGNLKESYNDAKQLIMVDSKNKLYQSHIKNIQDILTKKVEEAQSYTGKINTMFDLLGKTEDTEEKVKCLNNITVLAREYRNDAIWNHSDRQLLFDLCDITQKTEILEAAQRCLSALTIHSMEKSLQLFKIHGAQYFASLLYSSHQVLCRLGGLYLESIISGLTQIKTYRMAKEAFDAEQRLSCNKMYPKHYQKYTVDASVKQYVTDCFMTLIRACNSKKLSGAGRDSILEILLRFVPSKEGVDWSRDLLKAEGALGKLLEVGAASHRSGTKSDKIAGTISLIETTTKTKMTVAILLAQIYDDLISDQSRDLFRNTCCDFVLDLLTDDMIESKVEAANLIGLLFQGPHEAGSAVLGRPGILEGLLLLLQAGADSPLAYRRVALDALVQAVTKRDKCTGVAAQAVPLLQEVYKAPSSDPGMRMRALVGLCKLGSAGGRDASLQSLAPGSNVELARCCRRALLEDSAEDVRRWAAEGLAYLTLDAEVKQELIGDDQAVATLLSVTKSTGLESLYPLSTVLMNVTNSYEKQDIMPELLELAKYAKQHVPETHALDTDEHAAERLDRLMVAGLLAHTLHSLTTLSDSQAVSQGASREMVARVYLAAVTAEKHRGGIIQAGGGKALISLANTNSEAGKTIASQALAKLSITMDPRVAFPGQRSLEVIRPLIGLLHFENIALQNFESMLGLTNLASLDESHRRRIISEQGLNKIEHYMYEEHEELRRAATECICNLVQDESVRDKYLSPENDRVKALLLFCTEVEDPALVRAASGALASLSSDERLLSRLSKVKNWFEMLQLLVASELRDIQHRGAYILYNLIQNGTEEFCQFIVSSNMLEVLMALTKLPADSVNDDDRKAIVELAGVSLARLVELGLIKSISSR